MLSGFPRVLISMWMKKWKRWNQAFSERRNGASATGFPVDWFRIVGTGVLEYACTELADCYPEFKLWCLHCGAELSIMQVKSLSTYSIFPCFPSICLDGLLWGLSEIKWNAMKTQYSARDPVNTRLVFVLSLYSTASTVIVKNYSLLYLWGKYQKVASVSLILPVFAWVSSTPEPEAKPRS